MGLLVPSDRPLLELLQVRLLTKYPVKLALPKTHPHADKPELPLSLLKEERAGGRQRAIGEDTSKRCDFPRFMSRGRSVDARRSGLETRLTNHSGCF